MLNVVFEWLQTVVMMAGYVSGNATFPAALSREEEEKYLKQYAEGDEHAKNILIEHNLRLVAHIAKKYCDDRNAEDLISLGTIGLIKGINTYKMDKNKKLSSYISRCIENEVLMYLRSIRRQKNEVYIDECMGTDKDGNNMTLADILPSSDEDIADVVADNIETRKLHKILRDTLTQTEYTIIVQRYGLFGTKKRTQQEIADSLGISRSYVSRIEKKCLIKIAEYYNIKNNT